MTEPDTTEQLPLFPLGNVLFPDGEMSLRIFEVRYLEMVSRCLSEDRSFGVCLIAAGPEVGETALPYLVGTEAIIDACESAGTGVLNLSVRGSRRFDVLDHEVQTSGLLVGTVRWRAALPVVPVPSALNNILPLLAMIGGQRNNPLPQPHRLDDAEWVGSRYAEVLPINNRARQALLELDDPVSRLEIIQTFLREHGLLPTPRASGDG